MAHATARRMTPADMAREDVEDLAGDMILLALQRNWLEGRFLKMSWLYHDARRARRPTPEPEPEEEQQLEIDADTMRHVEDAVRTLSDDEAEALLLVGYFGFSAAEAARRMRISSYTLRRLRDDASLKVRRYLRGEM